MIRWESLVNRVSFVLCLCEKVQSCTHAFSSVAIGVFSENRTYDTDTRYFMCVMFRNNLGIMLEAAKCQKQQRRYKLKAQREPGLFDESFCKNKPQHRRHFPFYKVRKEKMWQYTYSCKGSTSQSHRITAPPSSISAVTPQKPHVEHILLERLEQTKILEGWAPDSCYYRENKRHLQKPQR